MKRSPVGINLAAFALVVGFGLQPEKACVEGGCTTPVEWHSPTCLEQCQPAWCASNMPVGAYQCNDAIEECNECGTTGRYRMNCRAFNSGTNG